MAPKKNVKMDLSSFLADDTFGSATDSWADEFDPSMLQNTTSTVDIGFELPSNEPVIPDQPPYTARIASFPDGTTEDELRNFFVDGLKLDDPEGVIEDFYCPKDMDGNLKTFAFITFITRELLVDALALNDQPIHGKPVYVSVAKPSKNQRRNEGGFNRGGPRGSRFDDEADWSGARGARSQREPRERRQEVEIDWDDMRSGRAPPTREHEFRGPPRERRPREDNFDWGVARGSQTQPEVQERERSFRGPPRERREPREDSFDWNGARGSQQQPEVQEGEKSFKPREHRQHHEAREPKDDTFDWGGARGSLVQKEAPKKTFKAKSSSDNLEWGSRGSMLNKQQPAAKAPAKTEKKEAAVDGPKKSMFSVLQNDDEDDEDDEEEKAASKTDATETITKATADLSLEEDGWTVQK